MFVCAYCRKQLVKEISQCVKGHSFCQECTGWFESCTVCKSLINPGMRNRLLEDIMTKLRMSCKWKGCKLELPISEIYKHERFCAYKKIICILCKNLVCFNSEDIKSHLVHEHKINFERYTSSIKIKCGKQKKVISGVLENIWVVVVGYWVQNKYHLTLQTLDYRDRSVTAKADKNYATEVFGGEPALILYASVKPNSSITIKML